ncbi:MAG: DUF3419 family protein [Planctomycetes bacterium]|nr:DUF3419 family protein [Planctomycetota bacterium]
MSTWTAPNPAATSKSLLKKSVQFNGAMTRKGMLERLFSLWFRGFIYNQIWEDPRVDAEALDLGPHSKLLTISSGGCNVLNYLVHSPARVAAVDLNRCHISLARLKIAAVEHMSSYEDFYRFFGSGNEKRNLDVYRDCLREKLDEPTRRFWDRRRFGGRRINYFAKGFYEYAKLGQFLRVSHRFARLLRRDPELLLAASTRDQQQHFFDTTVAPIFDNRFVRWAVGLPVSVFSLGIPPSQHDAMKSETEGHIVDIYRERVRRLVCDFPMDENYFAWQAFGRRYDHEQRRALPDYLREGNFDTLRANIHRVETYLTTLTDFLRDQPDASLDSFVLLDSQDWMPPHVIAELWREIARVGEPGSRIIFRTAGQRSPIEAALPPELMSRFSYQADRSRELHAKDRSAIYGMFHLYTKIN